MSYMNETLKKTMETALKSFGYKNNKHEDLKEDVQEQNSIDTQTAMGENYVFNKETYRKMKSEIKELLKELNEKEIYIMEQKTTAQKLAYQVNKLKTNVEDPLEVIF